jgi:hypothetical protein
MKEIVAAVLLIEFVRANGVNSDTLVQAVRERHISLLSNVEFEDEFVDDEERMMSIVGEDLLLRASPFVRGMLDIYSRTGVPGWDNNTCSMNWKLFACSAQLAAKAYIFDSSGSWEVIESSLATTDESIWMNGCDSKLPLYSELGYESKDSSNGSVLLWVGVAVAAIGAGWLVFSGKGR